MYANQAPYIYHTIYIVIISLIVLVSAVWGRIRMDNPLPAKRRFPVALVLLSAFAILFIGLRPINEETCDSVPYAAMFRQSGWMDLSESRDPVFYGLMKLMHHVGFTVSEYFLVVAALYVSAFAYCCYKIFGRNAVLPFVCILASLSFFGFGINVIRNGLGVAIFLIAYIFLTEKRYLLAVVIALLAVNIHGSVNIPVGALLIAYLFRKKPKYLYYGWGACLVLALILGQSVELYLNSHFSQEQGYDDEYLSNKDMDYMFSHMGFRWDFLLYGVVPIVISYYYIVRRKMQDARYQLLAGVYVICNGFWLFMASGWLSSRWAYLSWFIYVPVCLYPLYKYERGILQKRRIWLFFTGNYAFTMVMFFLGKFH